MKTKARKRIFTLLLALVMVLGLFPASTFADDVAAEPARIVTADPAAYAPEGGDEPAEPSEDVDPWYDDYGTQYYRDDSDGRIYYVADDASPFVVHFRDTTVSIADGEDAFADYEGAKLRVYPIEGEMSQNYVDVVESRFEKKLVDYLVMDIVVADANSVTCQPAEETEVSLSFSGPLCGEKTEVWHFIETPTKTKFTKSRGGSLNPAQLDASFEDRTVNCKTKSFSIYLLGIAEEPPTGEEGYELVFHNRDGDVVGRTIITDPEEDLPRPFGALIPEGVEPQQRDDYHAFWAIGTSSDGPQGTVWTAGRRLSAEDSIKASDFNEGILDIIPDYEKITYTVTFYQEDKTTVVATKTVDVDTSYCLNDIPQVPPKNGNGAKWVYDAGDGSIADFTNDVVITKDTDVWPQYTKNAFTVRFLVEGEEYASDTYNSGETLVLPGAPVVTGKHFNGWFDGETKYNGGETVTSDLTLTAQFSGQYEVRFIINEPGAERTVSIYYRDGGEAVGTLPQDPFLAGYIFEEKWVVQGTGEVVTTETIVTGDLVVVAQFRAVSIYNIRAEYYYVNDGGEEVVFNVDLLQIEASQLPYTITAPSTTQTDPNEVSGAPIYYPELQTQTVAESDFTDNACTVRFKYVPYTAVYEFVYKLKDLEGNGYTEIERTANIHGVLNSYVTPTVKTYPYAVLESAQGATITQASGQELEVLYTRKHFSLSYETNGGSYVTGTTVPYETVVTVSSTVPTRTGYTFGGWFLDEGLTQPAGSAIQITEDTTLYAKWNGADVDYTIIYMKEVYKETGTNDWEYENSRTVTGTVGETVFAATAPKLDTTPNGYELSADMNGTAEAGGSGESTEVTIEADGSTVLKVYYKLIRYTLVFDAIGYFHSGNYYYNNNSTGTITIGGENYQNSTYTIPDVVLGQPIGQMWPASATEVAGPNSYPHFDGWYGAESVYITKQYELVWPHVVNANADHVMTYHAIWSASTYSRNAFYWLQQADGTWAIAEEYTQLGLNTSNLGPKDIDGYTLHPGTNNSDAGTIPPSDDYPASGYTIEHVDAYEDTYRDGGGHRSSNPSGNERTITRTVDGISVTYTFDHAESYQYGFSTRYYYYYKGTVPAHDKEVDPYEYNFYYDRADYDIKYYYINKNAQKVLLTTKPDILFEADISSAEYNYTPTRPEELDSDYTFDGWYADAKYAKKYTFGTMPGHDLELYAKWNAPSYTVYFVDADDSTELFDSQTVEKYTKPTNPGTPTKTGYTFDGWYTTADGDTLFDWNTQITGDTTVYAHWGRKTLSYIVHYVDGNGDPVADDKTVTNPNLVVGQTITEQAIAVAGYRPQENSKDLVLKAEGNEITFIYSAKVDKTSYRVKYILDPAEYSGNIPVAGDKVVDEVPGNTASVIEMAVAVDYDTLYAAHPELDGLEFYPDAVEKTFVLTASEESNVFYFYYSSYKNALITVNFVDMDGNAITDPDVQYMKTGQSYTLARTPIDGWELNKVVEGTSYSGTSAGSSYTINDEYAANGLTFTLFYQKKVTITANSNSKQYDGTALTMPTELSDQVTVDGLLTDKGHELTGISLAFANADNGTNDGRLNAGVATVTPGSAQITGASTNYYKVRYISGTLEVTKINVTIRVEPDRWTGAKYNGTPYKTGFTNPSKGVADYVIISHAGYKTEYLDDIWDAITGKDNVIYEASAAGLHYYACAESNADDYTYEIELTQADLPENPNYQVSIYVRPGRLQILPAALTVTTESATKGYDGTPLTHAEGASVEGIVPADQNKVSWTVTGSQTDVGSSSNEVTIDWGDVPSGNYSITWNLGTLKVTPSYIVEYYYMNDDGTYPTSTENVSDPRTDEAGKHVSVTDADKVCDDTKYIFDESAENVLEANLPTAGNEITVLKVYFKLNKANVTVHHYLKGTTTKVANIPVQIFT